MASTAPASLLSLPRELRQQIYRELLENLIVAPADSLFVVHHCPIRSVNYAHPRLAILQSSQQIREEALPVFTSTVTLSLRHWAQHHLLTQGSHRLPRLSSISRLRLSPNMIGRGYYDALTLNTAFDTLEDLTISPLSVAVPHSSLVRLDAQKDILSGSSEDSLPEDSEAAKTSGNGASNRQLDLILSLMSRLNTDLADRVLGLLTAGKERGWSVTVGFEVRCASAGRLLLPGEEESRHVCSCPQGVEIGFELVGKR